AERVMEAQVEETVGDCAYGGGPTRKAFAEEQRMLTAKVPTSQNGECFPKRAFAIDLDRMEVRCPAGQTTTKYESRVFGAVGTSYFLMPPASHVPYGPNVSVAKRDVVLASNPKNDCSNRPAPIIKLRLDNGAYTNASSSNMRLPAW